MSSSLLLYYLDIITWMLSIIVWCCPVYSDCAQNNSSNVNGYASTTGAVTGIVFGGTIALTIVVAIIFVICYNFKEKQNVSSVSRATTTTSSLHNFECSRQNVPVQVFQTRSNPPPYALEATPRSPPPYPGCSIECTENRFEGQTGFINVKESDTPNNGHNYDVLESVRSPPPAYSRGGTAFW